MLPEQVTKLSILPVCKHRILWKGIQQADPSHVPSFKTVIHGAEMSSFTNTVYFS